MGVSRDIRHIVWTDLSLCLSILSGTCSCIYFNPEKVIHISIFEPNLTKHSLHTSKFFEKIYTQINFQICKRKI